MHKNVLLTIIFVLGIIVLICFVIKIKKSTQKPPTNWKWSNEWEKPISHNPIIEEKPSIATNYDEAIVMAGREKKLVLVFFTSSHCDWCKKMKTSIDIIDVRRASNKYITVTVDVDEDQKTSRKWNLSLVPAHLITDMNESKIKFKTGSMSPDNYISWIN